MDFNTKLQNYAELVVKSGLNLQKGQELLIYAPISAAPFVRLVTEKAYQAGAKLVTFDWADEALSKMKYTHCDMDVFENVPEWYALMDNSIAERGGAILSITSSDPNALKGIDPKKITAWRKAEYKACKPFYDGMDMGRNVWCIVGVPSAGWAKAVFPDCGEDEAVEKLWEAIFHTVRVDQADPIAAWAEHKRSFAERTRILNEKQFDTLTYHNSTGTDITIGLPENHVWAGGGDLTVGGTYFFPNMPTEEIFCSPHRDRVNGTVHSSMPLNYSGSVIDDFSLTFRDGVIVDYSAAEGYDVLKSIIETDEGSTRLGEVALVPKKSPISEMGLLFLNTLYDENASCHFAIGIGFPECLQGGRDMTEEEFAARGINVSAAHVDFMLGTDDLSIVGRQKDGTEFVLFRDGNWAF